MKRSYLLLVCCIVLKSTAAHAAAPTYRIEDIGVSGRSVNSIHLNNVGEVTFSVFPEEPEGSPPLPGESFLVQQEDLKNLGGLGGSRVVSTHINDSSQIVGLAESNSGNTVSFLYENGLLTGLEVPGSTGSLATAINEEGTIVGRASYAGNVSRAYRRTVDGIYKPLLTLGGNRAIATDINNSGTIVGSSQTKTDDFFVAFSLENNEIRNLGTLGGKSSHASAISEDSTIVGSSTLLSGIQHAALFVQDGTPIDLAPSWAQSAASDINDTHQAVGFVTDTPDQKFHAALFSSIGEQPVLLEDLIPKDSGWDVLTTAAGINNRGQIVGQGIFKGESSIFLLTPIPEPSSLALLACGLFTLCHLWKRQTRQEEWEKIP